MHPKVVSEHLGHTDISMTLRMYSHVLPNMQEDAVKIFAKSIFSYIFAKCLQIYIKTLENVDLKGFIVRMF